jgi:putative hydrolase of HD superfamily
MERLDFFVHEVFKLKRKKRAGWIRHDVENSESVAEHSFGTAILALILSHRFGLDSDKTTKMALVHDFAEYSVPDFTPFDDISQEEKFRLEKEAIENISSTLEDGEEILSLWQEFENGETNESKFVRKLDKLEMMFQTIEYAEEQPDKDLELFWKMIESFEFGELKEIFESLRNKKQASKIKD